jgi:uncharacterized lipoprotein YmbA
MLLGTRGSTVHPWPGQKRPAYQLEIDIVSFETDSAGKAQLVARWFLHDVPSGQTIAQNEAHLSATAAGTSSQLPVASLSKALGDFSLEIANAIHEFVQPNTTQSAVGTLPQAPPSRKL